MLLLITVGERGFHAISPHLRVDQILTTTRALFIVSSYTQIIRNINNADITLFCAR